MKEASGKHPQRCETCDFNPTWEGNNFDSCPLWVTLNDRYDDGFRDYKLQLLGSFVVTTQFTGCTLHSSVPRLAADPTRYMSEDQRKYILSFKEEDPLLMAYVEGQKAAEQRIAGVIADLERRAKHANEGIHSKDDFRLEWEWRKKAFDEAISLLRGDGKP